LVERALVGNVLRSSVKNFLHSTMISPVWPTWYALRGVSLVGAVLLVMVALGPGGAGQALAQEGTQPVVVLVDLDGAIDRISARFLSRAIDEAEDRRARLVVIRLDTPGGLLDSTRDIVSDIFASRVPVVVYVAPSGARAASAGTFIGASAGVLAMAPATNIGAAAVVGPGGEDLPKTLGRKATQDARALMRSIAERRGRPVGPLEATVATAAAYTAREAVRLGIVDLVAPTLNGLLENLHNRTIPAAGGAIAVQTRGTAVREVKMSFFERALSFLADPNLVFLLLSIGTLAITVELFHPGLWIPGSVGVISLILGFAGLGNLPFSWVGVALFAVATLFFFGESQAPGVGFFGIAGALTLALAGLFMIGSFGTPGLPGPSFAVSKWLLVAIGVIVGSLVLGLTLLVRSTRRLHYVSPLATENLLGQMAEVTNTLEPLGEVSVAGERWSAELAGGGLLEAGESVRIVGTRDLVLLVEPLSREGRAGKRTHSEGSERRAGRRSDERENDGIH
jgi:membrane-bound serine protease (ClpP class)